MNDSTSVHTVPMKDECETTPTNESASNAESDATTSASSWGAPVGTTPPTPEFEKGMREIVERANQRTPGQFKLDEIGGRLRETLESLGRAVAKLDTIRKDPGAIPEVITGAAMARRQIEADANQLMNEFVSEVAKQFLASEAS